MEAYLSRMFDKVVISVNCLMYVDMAMGDYLLVCIISPWQLHRLCSIK